MSTTGHDDPAPGAQEEVNPQHPQPQAQEEESQHPLPITHPEERKRVRTLTERGYEAYMTSFKGLKAKMTAAWKDFETVLTEASECSPDLKSLNAFEERLLTQEETYTLCFDQFQQFLLRTSTYEANDELKSHIEQFLDRKHIVRKILTQVKTLKHEALENLTVGSNTSERSSKSNNSSIAQRKRAKANAQRVRLEYVSKEANAEKKKAEVEANAQKQKAEVEANAQKQKAELEATIKVLNQEKELAAAEAEAEALENVANAAIYFDIPDDNKQGPDIETYIDEQAKSVTPANAHMNAPDNDMVTSMTKFLLRKDLVFSHLTNFTDSPEHYDAWKATFERVIKDLALSPSEQMDLFVKHLGPISVTYAQSIRASNASRPELGVTKMWQRLEECYGQPEMVESSLKKRLYRFPRINEGDYKRLYDLVDLLSEIESLKMNPKYSTLFAYFDSSAGILPIMRKLPTPIQNKWTSRASKYKQDRNVPFPPFSFFLTFMNETCKTLNDPGLVFEETMPKKVYPTASNQRFQKGVSVRKSKVEDDDLEKYCPYHKSNKHSLEKCNGFKALTYQEKRNVLKENNVCYKCCRSKAHIARNCPEDTQSALLNTAPSHGGEQSDATSKCTRLCGQNYKGRSCSKTLLVKVFREDPKNGVYVYATIDDQSNKSLITTDLLDTFGDFGDRINYKLSSCSGTVNRRGRHGNGYYLQSVDNSCTLKLPTMIECNELPNDKAEIATPDVARSYPHLKRIASQIPELDERAEIQLLIGRDLIEAHQIEEQIVGHPNAPIAQRLKLGWTIVGEVCLGKVHKPDVLNVKKTYVLKEGRATVFEPCTNNINIHDQESDIFLRTKEDNKIGSSVEDRKFVKLMDNEFEKSQNGHWVAPLPFRDQKPKLPNNKEMALKRAQSLHRSLKSDSAKKEHLVTFMGKIIDSGVAEVAPTRTESMECWYLPLFGVYHPRKPGQIRGVFDSSAPFKGLSLNDVLMSGPDLVNSLLGILMRFRKNTYAVTADLEQMFYQFLVKEEHRDFLRFLWYEDNNPDLPLIEYRMCVHVFGNKPSPAVATYGLRKSVENSESEVKQFVTENFYVDDGLTSFPTASEAIELLQKTQKVLHNEAGLRLHKIASNSKEVLEAFNPEDLGKEVKFLDFDKDNLPVTRSLGLGLDLETDSFVFEVPDVDKAFTRRGLLSTVNSIYDPIGFLAPFTIMGKILLRETTKNVTDWDSPLPPDHKEAWQLWGRSLRSFSDLQIPRMYLDISLDHANDIEIHIFSDASEKAIAAVAYMCAKVKDGYSQFAFVLGKAKLAPATGHTIPRLELCGAVLAVELWEIITENLDIKPSMVKFYTDSKVTLGYITNDTRRFYTYVANRVECIRNCTTPDQWNYVPTHLNPADSATRYALTNIDSRLDTWLHASPELEEMCRRGTEAPVYPLLNPDFDKEVRVEVDVKATSVSELGTSRYERFSTWMALVMGISFLTHIAKSFKKPSTCHGWHTCDGHKTADCLREAEITILKQVQQESFTREIKCLERQAPLPKDSTIVNLSPYLDDSGLLRVGGRLNKASKQLSVAETNPIVVPKGHIATLLIRHFHEKVKHQGRLFTEGAIRGNGYWVIGAKRSVSSVIHDCVKCRRLRGPVLQQQMADLPEDRLTPCPPFTAVGVDTFGPWDVLARKTRGGTANSKRWAILFTCLTTRAVHIELVEEMSSSAFINALRRFVSIRGPVKVYRSDRGTNFVGATDDLKIDTINVEDPTMRKCMYESGSSWIFNAPHSSHMGGVWERMIGVTRRILDSMFLDEKKGLTHDVLQTFMAEACAIINSRPITPVSTDPGDPAILTPASLLTMKPGNETVNFDTFNLKDMYRTSWKHVQGLSDIFWKRWREGYLQNLQVRRKWLERQPNLKDGDVVLLRDEHSRRYRWPLAVVERAISSEDGLVRKAVIRVWLDNKIVTYTRPVCELVLLVE